MVLKALMTPAKFLRRPFSAKACRRLVDSGFRDALLATALMASDLSDLSTKKNRTIVPT